MILSCCCPHNISLQHKPSLVFVTDASVHSPVTYPLFWSSKRQIIFRVEDLILPSLPSSAAAASWICLYNQHNQLVLHWLSFLSSTPGLTDVKKSPPGHVQLRFNSRLEFQSIINSPRDSPRSSPATVSELHPTLTLFPPTRKLTLDKIQTQDRRRWIILPAKPRDSCWPLTTTLRLSSLDYADVSPPLYLWLTGVFTVHSRVVKISSPPRLPPDLTQWAPHLMCNAIMPPSLCSLSSAWYICLWCHSPLTTTSPVV